MFHLPSNNIDLLGLGVLVTRPTLQATRLCALIQKYDGRPIHLPALTIEPVINAVRSQDLLSQSWDIAIYTSVNAVKFAAQLTPENKYPQATTFIAIGQATATQLELLGKTPDIVPVRQDSEGLLTLPIFAKPIGKRILIMRGVGGRALLNNVLKQRKAIVTIAEVYRRILPNISPKILTDIIFNWESKIDAVIVTSGEILDNLLVLLGDIGYPKLLDTSLIVVSERLQLKAKRLGFSKIIQANGANDTALLTALAQLAQMHHSY